MDKNELKEYDKLKPKFLTLEDELLYIISEVHYEYWDVRDQQINIVDIEEINFETETLYYIFEINGIYGESSIPFSLIFSDDIVKDVEKYKHGEDNKKMSDEEYYRRLREERMNRVNLTKFFSQKDVNK